MALIAAAVALAWSTSLRGPFQFDDMASITENPTIRDLSSFHWVSPPSNAGETVGGRPVLNLSFAINHVLGGLDVRWFRLANIFIHITAASTLFGLVRRTFSLPDMPKALRVRATPLACSIALLWALHPLQTQAVTYIVQRAESLMALFYLATLYGFVRSVGSPHRVLWLGFSWFACLFGMATKENMVSAPLAVFLFDRAFVAGSFSRAWQARWRWYVLLGATWVLLAFLVLGYGGSRGGTAGFDVSVGWRAYALTQFRAISHYGALCFWPSPLVFEYGTFFVQRFADVIWPASLVMVALAGTAYLLWRSPRIGFVAAIVWAVLAPTSLVPGTLQMIVEYRMYLPLAAIATLVCVGLAQLAGSRTTGWMLALVILTAVPFGVSTVARNRAYASELALWTDTVAKRPDNPRALNNLGEALYRRGRMSEAEGNFRRAIALQPNHAFAHFNLGVLLLGRGEWNAAATEFRSALAADPRYLNARVNLGVALDQLGEKSAAIEQFRQAIAQDPRANDARTGLAALLIEQGDGREGEALLKQVLTEAPEIGEAHYHWGLLQEKSGDTATAENEYMEAIRLKPTFAPAQLAAANLAAQRGDAAFAEARYRDAIRSAPDSAAPHFGLGNLLAAQEKFGPAIEEFRRALALSPRDLQVLNNLANCQLVTGRLDDAIANYQEILRRRPDDDAVRKNLELARQLSAGRGAVR